ncbi:glycosyltransferase [Paludibaculum fermentans]|uniref:glycosyltransferase n=1 Tax=Paludibaculum fermentans TaxID=1473598 RepID=UPI003EB96DEE
MKKRLLLFSEEFGPGGGGYGVSAHVLQTLSAHYDVTLMSYSQPQLEAIDLSFGTRLVDCQWRYEGPTLAERLLVSAIPDTSRFQRVNVLMKRARRLSEQFDVTFACCSLESDLGRPAIQYIHYPYMGHSDWRNQVPGSAPWPKLALAVLRGQTPRWMTVSRYSFDRMRRNLTLTNSRWTSGRIRELFDMPSSVLYPPAAGCNHPISWAKRRNGFVAIGRMEPAKRFDWMVEILALVRTRVPDVKLHICAPRDGMASTQALANGLEEMARKAGPWVQVHFNLSREELNGLLAENRYGLHARIDEHFGMAPAEMARAGCIPFVHDSGGQVEIVEGDPRLCYSSTEDAAAKMLAVMGDAALQDELRDKVSRHAELFSPESFARGLLNHVENFLTHGPAGPSKEHLH